MIFIDCCIKCRQPIHCWRCVALQGRGVCLGGWIITSRYKSVCWVKVGRVKWGGGREGGRLQWRYGKSTLNTKITMVSLTQTTASKAQHLQSWFFCTSGHKQNLTQWGWHSKGPVIPSAESEMTILIAANKQTLHDHCYHAIKVQKMSLSRSALWISKIIIVLIHFKSWYFISLKHANDSKGGCEVFLFI